MTTTEEHFARIERSYSCLCSHGHQCYSCRAMESLAALRSTIAEMERDRDGAVNAMAEYASQIAALTAEREAERKEVLRILEPFLHWPEWPSSEWPSSAQWQMLRALHVRLSAPRSTPDSPTAHHYTSTACHHGLHDQCRHQCKFCSIACECKCHALSSGSPLREPVEASEAANRDRAIIKAAGDLVEAMETCHQCGGILLVEEGPLYCHEGGCSSYCEDHAEPNCVPLDQLHARLKQALAFPICDTNPKGESDEGQPK